MTASSSSPTVQYSTVTSNQASILAQNLSLHSANNYLQSSLDPLFGWIFLKLYRRPSVTELGTSSKPKFITIAIHRRPLLPTVIVIIIIAILLTPAVSLLVGSHLFAFLFGVASSHYFRHYYVYPNSFKLSVVVVVFRLPFRSSTDCSFLSIFWAELAEITIMKEGLSLSLLGLTIFMESLAGLWVFQYLCEWDDDAAFSYHYVYYTFRVDGGSFASLIVACQHSCREAYY